MAITNRASDTAGPEKAGNALDATREPLESARDTNNSLMNTLKVQSGSSDTHGSSAQRYAALIAIGALAAWQVYLTLQLKVLLN